jgi:hypothetical protein
MGLDGAMVVPMVVPLRQAAVEGVPGWSSSGWSYGGRPRDGSARGGYPRGGRQDHRIMLWHKPARPCILCVESVVAQGMSHIIVRRD